jgi:hypothetical protein
MPAAAGSRENKFCSPFIAAKMQYFDQSEIERACSWRVGDGAARVFAGPETFR